MTWLRVSCDFAVKKSDGMLSSEGLTRARESASNNLVCSYGCWQKSSLLVGCGQGASIPYYMDLSIGLPE